MFIKLARFCLSMETNSGQDNSHPKCTLWTRCPRQVKPFLNPHPPTHTLLGYTSLALTHFPLYSFTLKMLFCSVWRHMLPSLPGYEVYRQIYLSLPQRVVAIDQRLVLGILRQKLVQSTNSLI